MFYIDFQKERMQREQNLTELVACGRQDGRGEETGKEARLLRMDFVLSF